MAVLGSGDGGQVSAQKGGKAREDLYLRNLEEEAPG